MHSDLQQLWAQLAARLKERPDMTTDLTHDKVASRGRVLTEESTPEKLVFEVERHNAIGGARYTPGLPMASHETRMVKYAFDPVTREITELNSQSVGLDIDVSALASEWADGIEFRVTCPSSQGEKFLVEEWGQNLFSFETVSLKGAKAKLRKHVAGMNWEADFESIDVPHGMDLGVHIKELGEYAIELAADKLEEEWNEAVASDD